MSLHAIQERDSKVVGINVEMVISVRGTPQEIASECKGDSIEEGSTFWSGIVLWRVWRVYGLLRPRALIKCRGSEEDQGKEQLTVGADLLGPSQGVPRGGRFVHPVGPCSGFLGMDGWGQQSHDRQIGFHGTPQEGHLAYPVDPSSRYHNRQVGFHGTPQEGHHAHPAGPSSGYATRPVGFYGTPQEGHHAHPVGPSSGYPNRRVGFYGTPQEGHHAYPEGPSSGYPNRQIGFYGTPQEGHQAYPVGPSSGHSGMQGWGHEFHGVPWQRACPYERPVTGGVGGGYQGRGVQRGPYYSGGPRVGPNYGNRGGSGGALRGSVPPVVSGRKGTAVVPGAVGGIPWGCWSWLRSDWSHGGTGLRDAWEARAELCGVAESRPWYRAGDSK